MKIQISMRLSSVVLTLVDQYAKDNSLNRSEAIHVLMMKGLVRMAEKRMEKNEKVY